MAHLFRHIESQKLYTIEHLTQELTLNRGAKEGIRAIPYKHSGDPITHTMEQLTKGEIDRFDPAGFVSKNFEVAYEI